MIPENDFENMNRVDALDAKQGRLPLHQARVEVSLIDILLFLLLLLLLLLLKD